MNNYSNGKCFNFGKMVRDEFPNDSWLTVLNSSEFVEFINKSEIRTTQLEYIQRGFDGEDMDGNKKESCGIFTFGAHKGKAYTEAPDQYIVWLNKQSWLASHPQLALYVKQFMESGSVNSLSKEEMANEFAKIKQSLK